MIKRKRATVRTVLVVQYSKILSKARKSVNGLRMQYLEHIMFLGDYPEGLRCVDVAKLTSRSEQNVFRIYKRCIRAGFIRKVGKLYVLSDSGQQVYNTICREFDESLKIITRTVLEDAGL